MRDCHNLGDEDTGDMDDRVTWVTSLYGYMVTAPSCKKRPLEKKMLAVNRAAYHNCLCICLLNAYGDIT